MCLCLYMYVRKKSNFVYTALCAFLFCVFYLELQDLNRIACFFFLYFNFQKHHDQIETSIGAYYTQHRNKKSNESTPIPLFPVSAYQNTENVMSNCESLNSIEFPLSRHHHWNARQYQERMRVKWREKVNSKWNVMPNKHEHEYTYKH